MQKVLKSSVALGLVVSLMACWTVQQWIAVAVADLPVLTQMALSIATLAGGTTPDPADLQTINNVSKEVTTDMALLQTLYNEYKASPSPATLNKITTAIETIQTQLPELLASAHIKDAALAAKVSSAVGIVLSTVQAFAQLIPQASVSEKVKANKAVKVPTPNELKASWQEKVGAPLQ